MKQTDTPAFRRWFGDSKVVDANGDPLVVYHGTNRGGFTEFDPESRKGFSSGLLFFTSSLDVADTYGNKNRMDPFPKKDHPTFQTIYEVRRFVESHENLFNGYSLGLHMGQQIVDDETDFPKIVQYWDLFWIKRSTGQSWDVGETKYRPKDVVDAANQAVRSGPGVDGVYAVFLRIERPLIVDARGASFGSIKFMDSDYWSADGIGGFAKEEGFDGAIIKNVRDTKYGFLSETPMPSDVYVVFDPRQIKSAFYNNGNFDPMSSDVRRNPIARPNRSHWLFSYGSNSPSRLQSRLGHELDEVKAAYAPEYKRAFRGFSRTWGGGVATLIPRRGATTYGYIARVSDEDLRALDRFEGVAAGVYKRDKITVETKTGPVSAVVYLHTSRQFNEPTRDYLNAIVDTIRAFWFNKDGSTVQVSDIGIE